MLYKFVNIMNNLRCSMVKWPVRRLMEQMPTFVLYIHAENKWFIRDVTAMSLYVLIKA